METSFRILKFVENFRKLFHLKKSSNSKLISFSFLHLVLAAFLFPTAQGPQYYTGAAVNIGFSCLGFVIALAMSFYYRKENARRDIAEGGKPIPGAILNTIEEHDLATGFRYVV